MEQAPRDPDHAVVLADLDPELHGLPLGIPAGVLGEGASGASRLTVRPSIEIKGTVCVCERHNGSRLVSPKQERARAIAATMAAVFARAH